MAKRKNRRSSSGSSSSDAHGYGDRDAAARPTPAAASPERNLPRPGSINSNSSPLAAPVSLEMESNTMRGISRIVGKFIIVDGKSPPPPDPAVQDPAILKKDPSPEPPPVSSTEISPAIHRSVPPAPSPAPPAAPEPAPAPAPAAAPNLGAAAGIPSRAVLVIGVPQHIVDSQVMQELESWGPVRSFFLSARSQGFVGAYYFDLRHAQSAVLSIQSQYWFQHWNPACMVQISSSAPPIAPFSENRSPSGQPPPQSFPRPYEPVKYELANVGFVTEDPRHRQEQHPPPQESHISSSPSKFSALAQPFDPYYGDGRGMIGGAAVWAEFHDVSSHGSGASDPNNQGTLVVFYLRMDFAVDSVRNLFQQYGDVMDVRESTTRKTKFVEFYDVRDAARAKEALDGANVEGRRIRIDFSRAGNWKRPRPYRSPSAPPAWYYPYYYNTGVPATAPYYQYEGTAATAYYTVAPFDHYDRAAATPYNFGGAAAFHTYYSPMYGTPAYYGYPPAYHYQQQQFYGYFSQPQLQPHLQPHLRSQLQSQQQQPPLLPSPAMFVPVAGSRSSYQYRQVAAVSRPEVKESGGAAAGKDGGGGDGSKTCIVSYSAERFEWVKKITKAGAKKTERDEMRYVFNPDESEEQGRTTLMIRNIPIKYSLNMITRVLDHHCATYNNKLKAEEKTSAYDFVYLPVDFMYKCNLGYAFVNFTTVEATKRLYEDFHNRRWEQFSSRKICQVAYARLQGRAQLENHFKDSKFACDTDEYLPLVFNPPRTGLQCSAPTVVTSLAGRRGARQLQQQQLSLALQPAEESSSSAPAGEDQSEDAKESSEAPQTSTEVESFEWEDQQSELDEEDGGELEEGEIRDADDEDEDEFLDADDDDDDDDDEANSEYFK